MDVFLSHLAGLVIVMCSPSSSALGVRYLRSRKIEDFDGKILWNYRERMYGMSLMYCHTQCLEDEVCMSFFYHHVNKTCQTHGLVFFNPKDGDLSPGTKYYKTVQDFCPSNLGYIYNRVLNLCYKLHYDVGMAYSSARQVCQSEGGDLITIDTKAKLDHMAQTIGASTFPGPFLIGARGGVVDDDWIWVNGEEIEEDWWCPGEPTNEGGDWDTAVLLESGGTGCFNDIPDWFASYFFCELKNHTDQLGSCEDNSALIDTDK